MSGALLFWDASALVPLLLEEANSRLVRELWSNTREAHAWDWVLVEVDAALIRRKAGSLIWQDWKKIQLELRMYSIQNEDLRNLRTLNRGMGLRAADAGHLFLYYSLVQRFFELELITFDREMIEAASRLRLPLHPACTQS